MNRTVLGELSSAGRDDRGMQYTVRTMGGPEIVPSEHGPHLIA